jgi:hypothetical protein
VRAHAGCCCCCCCMICVCDYYVVCCWCAREDWPWPRQRGHCAPCSFVLASCVLYGMACCVRMYGCGGCCSVSTRLHLGCHICASSAAVVVPRTLPWPRRPRGIARKIVCGWGGANLLSAPIRVLAPLWPPPLACSTTARLDTASSRVGNSAWPRHFFELTVACLRRVALLKSLHTLPCRPMAPACCPRYCGLQPVACPCKTGVWQPWHLG